MLNSNGKCEHCNGTVRNSEGRRIPIEQLTAIHNESCPGLHKRGTK